MLYEFKTLKQMENLQGVCFCETFIYTSTEGVFSALVGLIDVLTIFQKRYFENVNETKFHFNDLINKKIN